MTQETNTPKTDPLFVASLGRAMRILEAFDHSPQSLSLTELTRITGLNRSAVQRFLHTWQTLGYLEKDPASKRFLLSPKILGIGYSFLRANRLVEVSTPLLLDLARRTGNSVYLGTLEGVDIIYLVRIPRRFALFEATLPGRRVPAFCASGGRAFLSQLDDQVAEDIIRRSKLSRITPLTVTDPELIMAEVRKARERGYCIASQELLMGEISISAPVCDADGSPLATLHVAAKLSEWPYERLEREMAPLVTEAALALRSAAPA